MAEEIKELIEKIQEEGIRAAEDKAKAIEEAARKKAMDLIETAESEARKTLEDAHNSISKAEDSARASLKQTARDVVIGLKKEITEILDRIVLHHVRKALTPDEMTKLISHLVKEYRAKEKGDVAISLKKEDAQNIENMLFGELPEELKKGLKLRPSEDIQGGFTISYDHNKSYYDFTDKALADYISSYIKPKLAEILKD